MIFGHKEVRIDVLFTCVVLPRDETESSVGSLGLRGANHIRKNPEPVLGFEPSARYNS